MNKDELYIAAVCAIGFLGLLIIFGIAAVLDAPQIAQWHRLASQVGLSVRTFGPVGRLFGLIEGYAVTVEHIFTPDPARPHDDESVIAWTRIQMAVGNPRQSAFVFGRSGVLNSTAGRFAKEFANTTAVTLGSLELPQSFFVKDTATGLVQSLLFSDSEMEDALVAVETPYFIRLDGQQLSYTELGTELMDKEHIEGSARQLKRKIGLLIRIARHVDSPVGV